uniref:E3 ubiquitin protein ligase n=1 Tax=Lepeophtheirus salmonis TaxID=72036 RepID=A0A0K2V376_LEPSM
MFKRGAAAPLEPTTGEKKRRIVFEPLQLGPISNLEELDIKTLQFQNHKLGLRLTQRIKIEEELRQRIDQLEKRQTRDDAVINVINRYWNQLNEDIRVLLERFDAETGDEGEKKNEDISTTSFLSQLSTWHKEELDANLANRVQVSQRAVAKIIQAFDHLIQRNDRISRAIRGEEFLDPELDEASESNNKDGESSSDEAPKKKSSSKKEDKKSSSSLPPKVEDSHSKSLPASNAEPKKDGDDDKKKSESDKENKKSEPKEKKKMPIPPLDIQVVELNQNLQEENKRLHYLNTQLHEKNHFLSLKQAEIQELIDAKEVKSEELLNKVDDLEYEFGKCRMRNEKLEAGLMETQEKLKIYVDKDGGGKLDQKVVLSNVERKTIEQIRHDLEEQRELATNRLVELEKTSSSCKNLLKEVECLKMELSTLPEHVVVETTEHKCLQSQFSVLYNEAMQLKTQVEESRNQLQNCKNAHMRQIEQMESEELLAQKKLRTEVIQLEDMLAQVRKEYEMLRIEFEQNLAANEQTGPINKEMRNLITSLQTHNVQLKGDVARYRRKCKESNFEITKLRKELEDMKTAEIKALQAKKLEMQAKEEIKQEPDHASGGEGSSLTPGDSSCNAGSMPTQPMETNIVIGDSSSDDSQNGLIKPKLEAINIDDNGGSDSTAIKEDTTPNHDEGSPDSDGTATVKNEKPSVNQIKREPGINPSNKETLIKLEEMVKLRGKDAEIMKDLKTQLKNAQKDVKEMKLLLDMYKACTKEQRDKAQVMAAEKKMRAELEDLRGQLKKVTDIKKEEKKRCVDEDVARRIKQLEDQVLQLQKQVANHKQEEEALLSEMEVTGQAFEDMQEQNSRLIQQLREKDDANFKLMSERIKANQIQRLAREERDMLTQQVNTLTTQVEAQNQVVRKLEEKERLLQNNLVAVEKELVMRQQAMEMHKRKAIESAQSAADLKLHLEKYHSQIKEVQQTVAEKTSALEAEAFKTKRLHEELGLVKRKLERLRKIEMASDMDEILKEEIREYKETLTCPSCKVKRKDAVLTKCFHCFCYDCLRTRYETRQRKCPKCNAAFGASDYHRLYLA